METIGVVGEMATAFRAEIAEGAEIAEERIGRSYVLSDLRAWGCLTHA